jgi:hypothetical protein
MPEYYDDEYNNNDCFSESTVSEDQEMTLFKNKHLHKIKRRMYDVKKGIFMMKTLHVYSSGDVGSVILNAEYGTKYQFAKNLATGEYQRFDAIYDLTNLPTSQPRKFDKKIIQQKVGSYDEDVYFKVMICTGENKLKNEPITLFYHTPEQYEHHFQVEIPLSEKKRWAQKRKELMKNYQYKSLYTNENVVQSAPVHDGVDVVVK